METGIQVQLTRIYASIGFMHSQLRLLYLSILVAMVTVKLPSVSGKYVDGTMT